jgi:hypothetical protein
MIPIIHILENRAIQAGIEIENLCEENISSMATGQERIKSKVAMSKGDKIDNMKIWVENYCKIVSPNDLLKFIGDGIAENDKIIKYKTQNPIQLEIKFET